MARMRVIKPDMFRGFTVSGWPIPVRWTFAGLLTYLDDEGRGRDDARLIKAEIYPLDDDITSRKVEQHLALISRSGPLCRYEAGGHQYLHLTEWTGSEEWSQRVNRPSPSRIPHCPIHEGASDVPGDVPEDSQGAQGVLTEPAVSTQGVGSEPSLPRAQARASADQGTGNSNHSVGDAHEASMSDTQRIVGAWVDAAIARQGDRPDEKLIAQVGRGAKALLRQGKDLNRLLVAAEAAGANGYTDLGRQLLRANPNGARGTPVEAVPNPTETTLGPA
jgi:hypothetical protein